MRQSRFIGTIVACAMFLLFIGFMPVNAHAGVCTTPPCVNSADIIDGEVKTSDIAAGAVTTGKLKNNAVTGAKVQDGSLTGTDIQNGSVTGTDIQDGSIGSADIQDGAVSGADIGAGAVGTSNISDGAVTTGKIAPGAVGSTQINNTQIQSRVTGTCAVGSSINSVNQDGSVVCETDDNTTYTPGTGINIINGSVIGIADGGVGSTQITDGSVSSAKIAIGSVGSAQINNTQVQGRVTGTCTTGSSIRTVNQDGTVVCEADDNSIYTAGTGINITDTTINISNGGVGTTQIGDGSVTTSKIGTGAIGSSQIATGGVASANIAPLSVGTSHLIDGNVTTAKIMNSAIGSTQISDGSITSVDVGFNYAGSASKGGAASDLSCIGCVSQTELNFGGVKPAQRIVVAESGGDYTSIGAALAAISPSSSNPYVIDVMPGIYTEYITMKSYVHLRGAGQNVTIIQSPNIIYDVITISGIREVIVSGFTIKGGRRGIYHYQNGVYIPSNSVIIENNLITGNNWEGIDNAFGVTNTNIMIRNNDINVNTGGGIFNSSASPTIVGNRISANLSTGIYNSSSSSPMIINNIITDNTSTGIYVGSGSSALIKENTIKFNGGYGVINSGTSVAFKVIHNWITDNGGTTYDDIYCNAIGSGENVSFNVFNSRTNNGVCDGNFNVNYYGGTW